MTKHYHSLSTIFSLLLILTTNIETIALVASAPGISVNTFVDTAPQGPVEIAAPPLSLRLRSTTECDLHDVASLLATVTTNADESQGNWKTSMEILRNKSAWHILLSSRYEAMKEGERAAKHEPLDDAINNVDRMRLLWAHDSFRRKLEKAAAMAKEPHVWKDQSYNECPQHPDSLRHAMITAEDRTTGRLVGFCEVAMLALPSIHQTECVSIACAPTIVNLATSPKHRRQGIAFALLTSAEHYVQRKWSHDEITLYVESANDGAVALYSKHGFTQGIGESNGKLYMTKAIQQTRERETVAT
jgi:ribosomal protein S18 acetylase RimI-like enzyme